MRLMRSIFSELLGMFAGDAPLSVTAILIVGVAAALRLLSPLPHIFAGAVLVAGCVAVIVWRTQVHRPK